MCKWAVSTFGLNWPIVPPFRLSYKVREQGPKGWGFQLRDGSGSGIGKSISGRIGYGSGTGIFIIYLSIRYYRVVQILIGYFSGISLRHIYLMVPDGFQWAPIVCMVDDGR